MLTSVPNDNGISLCRGQNSENVVSCSNVECGVFAIAFAVSLALGTNPKHVTFDTSKMRPHLAVCLKAQKLSMFPVF